MYLSFADNGSYERVIVENHGTQQELDEADGSWKVLGSYLVIDDERMLIKSVNGNTLVLNYEDEGILTFTKCDYSELDAARK